MSDDYIIWDEVQPDPHTPEGREFLEKFNRWTKTVLRDSFLYGRWALPEHDTHWLEGYKNRLGEE